jgi:hypothetical protein
MFIRRALLLPPGAAQLLDRIGQVGNTYHGEYNDDQKQREGPFHKYGVGAIRYLQGTMKVALSQTPQNHPQNDALVGPLMLEKEIS